MATRPTNTSALSKGCGHIPVSPSPASPACPSPAGLPLLWVLEPGEGRREGRREGRERGGGRGGEGGEEGRRNDT